MCIFASMVWTRASCDLRLRAMLYPCICPGRPPALLRPMLQVERPNESFRIKLIGGQQIETR
jgi:hypothetical protein